MKNLLKTKQDYRNYARKKRRELTPLKIAEISNAVCTKITELEQYKNAKIIASFYPVGNEVDLTSLHQDSMKQFFLPRVMDEENIEFYPYETTTVMEKNKWGILEPPQQNGFKPVIPDIILIPALMVDKKGYRLGYGKGYYDRYLAKLPKTCLKIVPVPEELFVEALPYDDFDIPVDFALTQSDVYFFC